MTDKVQKIREEVERLQNELIQEKEKGYGSDADDACILELQNVLTYIDSLQEEPVSEDLEVELTSYMKNSFTSVEEPDEFLTTVNMYETDNRLRFQDGRLYITQTPFKDGKQIDFPEMVDITEDVLNTFIEIIKERDRNRCK